MLAQIIHYFQTSSAEYWGYVGQHLFLSLIYRHGYCFATRLFRLKKQSSSSLLSDVQSIAQNYSELGFTFILIPFMGSGVVPVIIALVVLTLPPLVVNTILGFNEVSPVLKEVGLSLGMDQKQLLKQITLPLALPYILNGIKLALVEIISSPTLATYIGAGGLGTLTFTGLGLYKMQFIIIGAVSVALLSLLSMLLMDWLIRKVKENDQNNY